MRSKKRRWLTRILRPRHGSFKEFAKEILRPRFLLTLSVLVLIDVMRSHTWVFEYPGVRSQEILQASIPPLPAKYARIISITPQDYRQIFDEVIDPVPLDAAIDRILEFKPAVVVVDLDTAAQRFHKLKKRPQSMIVWARDAEEEGYIGDRTLTLLPLRGQMDSNGVLWGLALFPRSLDWTVRTYRRAYNVGSAQKEALYWEAVTRFCATADGKPVPACAKITVLAQKLTSGVSHDEDLVVPIRHARYKFEPFPLGDLEISGGETASARSDLVGKIVLLGGTYSHEDRHQTPFAVLNGVELVASAVEAELNEQGERELGSVGSVGLKLVIAVLIAATHYFLKPAYAALTSIGLLAFFIFFGGLIAAYVASYRANLVPFFVGILIEQLYTAADTAAKGISRERT